MDALNIPSIGFMPDMGWHLSLSCTRVCVTSGTASPRVKRVLTGTSAESNGCLGGLGGSTRADFLVRASRVQTGFRRSVGELGWDVCGHRWHRDHVAWTEKLFGDALSEAKRNNAALGITLKDAVKLCELKHLVDDVDVVVFEPQIIWIEGEEYLDELLRHVLSPILPRQAKGSIKCCEAKSATLS